jgi:amino acid adenylation domain-containing protein
MSHNVRPTTGNEIAIIGMAGRFPKAGDIGQFWENLRAGVEALTEVTADDLRAAGVDPAVLDDPSYVRRVFALDDPEHFDPEFFGFTPAEAEMLDPQQRLLLESAWSALEHSGYDPDRYPGLIGVFAGVGRNSYFLHALSARPELLASAGEYHTLIGNERDFPTTHISYRMNLRGPSIDVQTACSTSGVAVHLACNSLRGGECDIALAGGSKVIVPNRQGYWYVEGGPLAPEGHVRAFDAGANGMVRGSGAVMLVLKRLDDALADGDTVHGVILGSAVNNDGGAKIGFTAPSVEGQAAVIAEALTAANVEAESIGYVETHGTGTILGDPIEIAGLTSAFRRFTDRQGFCRIGSVKTNIGHLDAAATAAGIVKTVLAFRHEVLPASLNFTAPNPGIDFAGSPFSVNSALTPWPRQAAPRRAGVSSFGLGGTNAHLVLEEPPVTAPGNPGRPAQLVPLSARTEAALDEATAGLARHLSARADDALADIAWTLQNGRRQMNWRRFVIARDVRTAADALERRDPREVLTRAVGTVAPAAAWMFPGGGAQYQGMAARLHAVEPRFRDAIAECAALLPPDQRAALAAMLAADAPGANADFERPSLALPALFAVEYALARLLNALGLAPAAMLGHSMGEYTAACLAGVFSLENAVKVVLTRGQLFERLPAGGMVSVPLAEADLRPLLHDGLSIAAINRGDACVASGTVSAIDALVARLDRDGIESTRLHISVAAHSRLVEPILDEFGDALSRIPMAPPSVPFISNLTGTWITASQATDPGYWVRHLRETVRFADGLDTMLADPGRALVEVGPGQTLSAFARQHPRRTPDQVVVSTVRHPREAGDDYEILLRALGQLWLSGVSVDWEALHDGERRRRVELPTYPFQRRRYSLVGDRQVSQQAAGSTITAPRVPEIAAPVGGLAAPAPSTPTAPPAAPAAAEVPRRDRLVVELRRIVQELSGMDAGRLDANATFLELGLDSLFLARANNAFKKRFNVRLTTRHLMEKTPSLTALAAHLDAELPSDAFPAETPAASTVAAQQRPAMTLPAATLPAMPAMPAMPAPGTPAGGSEGALMKLIEGQMQLMHAQLAALRGQTIPAAIDAAAPVATALPVVPSTSTPPSPPVKAATTPDATSPWQPVAKGRAAAAGLTPAQQAYLDGLIARVTARTPKSKAQTQANRAQLADPRTVQGFRKQWKEMVYPIVSDRAQGSRIWDVDGNEYIDLVNGYGVVFFGHSMPFILDAAREQLDRTLAIGPQTALAGEVAKLVCELTGQERAAFCNTGSEAVLAAIRMARTVTGKTKLATFSGHYHGIFDEVLVKGTGSGAERRPVPIAPGIPANKVEDVVVLEYGNMESLDVIRRHAGELAMVMVEPVRSRNLDHQPREFVQALRRVTQELGIPLLFDEMVTGFRSHPGGAQAIYGVKADLATYGKVVGGEFPIGVVAGKKEYLDALDGGMWSYGDDSTPEADMTWFAGTFVRHPLALAAAKAVLTRIKQEGPALQESLNSRTTGFVRELNDHFRATSAPIHLEHFSSAFILTFTSFQEYSPLLFYELHTRGIYTYEGRPAFFTLAHSDADMARVATAIKESVAALQDVGLFPGAAPRSTDEVRTLPLAEGQQEIWLATRLGDDASRAFNLASTLRLRGRLRLDALRTAVAQLVLRHEALRAIPNDDGLTQRILPSLPIEVPLEDLAPLAVSERQARLAQLRDAEVETPFDLSRGPLIRTTIVRLAEDDHFFMLTTHHLVCDGWSSGVLLRELGHLYEAACTGRPAALKPPMQLTEFVQYSEANRRSEERADAEAYWLKEYTGTIPVLQLPTDRPRPPRKTFRAKRFTQPLDDAFVARMKHLAASSGATLFNTLFAGFGALLNRLAGQDDLVVGFSLAGQAAITDRDLVGHCVTFLPLRLRPTGAMPFAEFLGSVRGKVLDAVEYQNLAFGGLLQKLRMPRDPSRVPLMSVAFNLDPSGLGLRFHDLAAETGSIPRHYENFDLFFNIVELSADKLEIQCTFNLDLFDEATIQHRVDQFVALMDGAAAAKELPIGQLPLLPALQRPGVSDVTHADTLAQRFERQARATPDALALTHDDISLTYAQLDERANRLAHRLRAAGITAGRLVGLLLDRSLDMVVAVLAVAKAGGAYVPVDASSPAARVAATFSDAGAEVVITRRSLAGLVAPGSADLVLVDDPSLAQQPTTAPAPAGGPEDAAYVIYTSGSTGTPKGVVVTHRNVTRLFDATRGWFDFGARDVWTLFHSIAFDFSVWELWGAILHGGRLVVVPQDVTRSPEQFHDLLQREGVTVLNQTPSAFRMLTQVDGSSRRTARLALRFVIFGGEKLTLESLRGWIERHGDESPRLVNMYGITETTVHVTYRRIQRADLDRGLGSVIGAPIPDLAVYLLDSAGHPVRDGERGEIYVGGAGVARGYLNRPELTASRFLPDPFAGGDGALMYRSGDEARRLPDGDLEYLGRLDQQVKIRGFRIELGEIESTLRRQPDVRDVAVVPRAGDEDDAALVAYVVPKSGAGSARQQQIGVWHDEWTALYESGRRTAERSGAAHLDDRAILGELAAQADFEQEWREFQGQTLDRIRALRPRRVLEIGCGTGQVLLHIAPECEAYTGTDFAALAIDEVRRQLAASPRPLPHVKVRRQPGDDFTGIEPGSLDTVIVNSVVQYFPDVEYLVRVLEGAVRALAPGGRIYIGDVQSFALLGPHHLGEQLARLDPQKTAAECRRIVEHRVEIEDELVVDPAFFEALAERVPSVAHVEFHHRRGRVDNETTRFHYDVVLHLAPLPGGAGVADLAWQPWDAAATPAALRARLLAAGGPDVIAFRDVPNARTTRALAAWRLLTGAAVPATVGALREAAEREAGGIHPEDLWALEADTPYRVEIRFSDAAASGTFDLLLVRQQAPIGLLRGRASDVQREWPAAYANNPTWKRETERLPALLRQYARERLPEYMVPSAIVLLDKLPLTVNGKLDTGALPAPSADRPAPAPRDVPRTDLEREVATVWAEVLRVDDVGLRDDFFERGGHSLLAVQVIVKLRERLHVDISLGSLFEAPTVEQLARRIEALQYVRTAGAEPSADMEEIEL